MAAAVVKSFATASCSSGSFARHSAVGPRRVDPERPSAQQKEQAHRKARPKRPSALIRPYNAAAERPEVVRPPTR